jgi:hypothetical protein
LSRSTTAGTRIFGENALVDVTPEVELQAPSL